MVVYSSILHCEYLQDLQLVDQSLCYPKGVLKDVIIRVGQSYVLVDFVVLETCGDERAPIILG